MLKSFRHFLISPYHNSNKNALKLFNILVRYYPDFSYNELTKEHIFSLIYTGKYTEWKVRNLLSDLAILANEFLVIEKLKNKKLQKVHFLNDQYLNLKLYDNFTKSYIAVMKEMDNSTVKDTEYFYFRWLFEDQMLDARIRTEREYSDYSEQVHKAANVLIDFILYQSMEFFQSTYVADESIKSAKKASYVKHLLDCLLENYTELDEQFKTFYSLYKLKLSATKDNFHELERLFSENGDKFDYSQQRNFYITLHMFCINSVNSNDFEFVKHLKKFTDIMAERGFDNTQSGYLSEITYRNAAILGKITGELKWAEVYLEKFKELLNPEIMESNYRFSMATIRFHEAKFEEAIKLLSTVKYEDFLLKYQVDCLLLRIHYELGNFDNAYSLMDSNAHFIQNNPVSPESYRTFYRNFLKFYKKVLSLKSEQSKEGLKALREEITKINSIASKGWLLEKLAELGGE